MANEEHLAILRQGMRSWDAWRMDHPDIQPDLSGVDLAGIDLSGADLRDVILTMADLNKSNLSGANLGGASLRITSLKKANLTGSDLSWTDLMQANLQGANVSGAEFHRADLNGTILRDADLKNASLSGAHVTNVDLKRANFTRIHIGATTFADTDLSNVIGLEAVQHESPSTIGIDTIYRSHGNIPDVFLRGCGVPDSLIEQIPSLIGAMRPIQFYSCFISYSSEDDEFAKRLHGRMQQEHLRVWFAPEDMKAGEKLYEQIDRAIQIHDRLLLVLSQNSINSKWVETEIRRARRTELKGNRRKLFPIRLVSYEELQEWVCFDADGGEDLATEVRSYHIPDFSNWKDHNAFEAAFSKLLRDLKAAETTLPSR